MAAVAGVPTLAATRWGWVSTLEDHGRDVHATRSKGAAAEVFIPPEPIDKGIDFRTTRPVNFRPGNNPW